LLDNHSYNNNNKNDAKNNNNNNIINECTKVFRGSKKATDEILRFVSKATKEINACLDSTGPSVMVENTNIKRARIDAKRRGVRLRYITEITNDNIHQCKELLGFVDELRHLNGIKGNFEICDMNEYVAMATLQEAQPISELIYSNVKEIVEQQQYVFDTFWSKSIPSEERIKEIEQGIKPATLEFIKDPQEAQKLEWDLLSSSSEEILMIYSTVNAFYVQESAGVTYLLSQLAKNGLNIKLIAPIDPSINNNNNTTLRNLIQQHSSIHIRDIKPSSTPIRFKCLIVDRKHSLVMELKDDSKQDFKSTIGLSTYSNSAPTVLSYASIFETLWQQTELHEELKRADHIKNEFINIAAHELRTPIMPIIAGLEIIEYKLGDKIQSVKKELEIVYRNAARLQKLAEDILQISRIESGTFRINTEDEVDIGCLILDVIRDIEKKYKQSDKKDKVSISFVPSGKEQEEGLSTAETHDSYSQKQTQSKLLTTTISCDRPKITEVLFNLIDNAIKFTDSGTVSIHLKSDYHDRPRYHNHHHSEHAVAADNYHSLSSYSHSSNTTGGGDDDDMKVIGNIEISITDTGKGIDPSIKDRLFDKFVTTSNKGTGLGLYLSKKIVELHGGRIWATDNSDGKKGATFTFSLPIKKKQNLPSK
jgi:two-component system sensor histidine kinase VicK